MGNQSLKILDGARCSVCGGRLQENGYYREPTPEEKQKGLWKGLYDWRNGSVFVRTSTPYCRGCGHKDAV